MADNSLDLFSNQESSDASFQSSNFDSSTGVDSNASTDSGPGPKPKKIVKVNTDRSLKNGGVTKSRALSQKDLDFFAKQEAFSQQIQANHAAEQKKKQAKKYAPTNPVETAVFQEHGEDVGVQLKKDQERLNQLKSKQFSSLIGENFDDFYKTLSGVKTKENDGDPLTYLLNMGKDVAAGAASAAGALVKAGYDKYTKGRFTDKEEVEFQKLNDKVNKITKPVLLKQKQQLEQEFDKAAKTYGIDKNKVMYNTWSEDEDLKYKIANNYQRALGAYDDAIEDTGFWGGMFTDRVGVLQAVDDVEKGLFLAKMKEKGGNMTPAEQELFKSYVLSDQAVNGKLNNNKNYELGKGLRMSLEFMAEMAVGGKIVGKATKDLLKKQIQKDLANVVLTPTLQPSTYSKAMQEYTGSMQMTEDMDGVANYYTSDKQKNYAVKFIKERVSVINSDIQRIKASGDTSDEAKIRLQQLQFEKEHRLSTRDQLVDENGKLRQSETSFGKSLATGYVENLKEGFTEKFVGGAFDKVAGKVGKAMAGGTGKVGSKVQKFNDFLHNTKGDLDNALFNNTAGKLSKQFFTNVGPAKVLHSLPAEMFEEIAVNLLPSVGGDYGKQLEQLGDADFYSSVMAQTLLMGGGTQALANGLHYGKMWTDKDYRDSIKEKNSLLESLKQQYKGIDKAISDDVLAKDISMSTLGTIHQVNEYQARIADLRNPETENPEGLTQEERNEKADLLERNSFVNMSVQAIQMGTENDLRRALQNLSQNKNVSEETRKNAVVGIESLKTYENILNKNKDLVNSGTVTDLEIRKSLMENTIKPVAQKLEQSKAGLQTILDRYNDSVEVEDQMTETNFYRFLSSSLEEDFKDVPDTFYNFLEAHQDKKKVRDYMNNAFVANNLDRAMKELEDKLDYQTDPANREEIKKEIKAKVDAIKAETATPETATKVKEEINDGGINAKVNNKIDEKVAKDIQTHPGQEFDVQDGYEDLGDPANDNPGNKVDTKEFFGDAFDPTVEDVEAPATVVETPKDATASEQENLLTGQELFAPVTYNPNSDSHKKQVEKVSAGIRAMKAKNPNVNFDGLVALLRSDFGSANIEQSFNIIAEAWNQSTQEPVSKEDVDKVYADNFGTNTFDRSMFATSGITEVVAEHSTPQELVKSEESNAPEAVIGLDPVTGRVGKLFNGYKIADGNVKVALLGLNYSISEDGTTYETITNDLNPSSFPVLHWENFKTGDKVPLSFKWDYFDMQGTRPMRMWKDNDSDFPRQIKTNVKIVVESIFGEGSYNEVLRKTATPEGRKELLENEEFLKIVPTAFTVNGSQLEVGINDYHWWNAANTALPTDEAGNVLPEARSRIIEAGRAYNLATRKVMAANPNLSVELEISERREGFHNKQLEKDADKFNSLEDAFKGDLQAAKDKIAIVVVGKNNFLQSERINDKPVVMLGGKRVSTSDIRNYDAWIKSMEDTANGKASGKVAMITQSGVVNGKPVYTIHSVINNHQSQTARFTAYNDIHDQIEADRKLYQKLVAEGKAIPEELQKKEDAFQKMNLSLKDTSTFKYFKKFYTEKRKVNLSTQAEVDKYNAKITDPTKHKKIGDSRYVTNEDVTDAEGAVVENMFRQDYDPEYSNTKRSKSVIDILDMTTPQEFYENLLAGTLKTTDYKTILLKNLHTQYIFSKIEDGAHDPIYTTEVQPIISFNRTHLPKEQIGEISKSGVNTTTAEEKIVQEKTVLTKQLENEKAELQSTEDAKAKERIEKRINVIEKKIEALPAVTVQERIEKAAAETVAQSEREFTDSDLIDINNELVFRVISKIDISKPFTKLQIAEHLLNSYNEFKDELAAKGLARELMFLTDNEGQILGKTSYDGSAIERIDALLELDQEEEVIASAEFIKDQNKESFENNMIKYLSGKVRMLMAGIPDTRGVNDGFAGTQQYMPFPQSVDALQQILSEVDNNTLPAILDKIKTQVAINPKEFKFYEEIAERLIMLEKKSPETLNEILYFLYQPKTEMIFLGYEGNKNKFKASKYDANSKNASIVKAQRWGQQLKNSPILTKYEEGYFKLNADVVARANTLYDSIKANKADVDTNEVAEFLSYFGISLNPSTLQKMKENSFENAEHTLFTNTKKNKETGETEEAEETGILKNNGLIDLLKKNLDIATKETRQLVFNNRYVEDDTKQFTLNLLTNDTNNVLKTLINADNLVSFVPMQSMYIAGKMINSYQQPKSITNTVTKLLNDPRYLKKIKDTSITSESIITELLEDNPEFKAYFGVVNVSLEAVKRLRDASRDDMGITNLSEKDHTVTTINLFAHTDGKIKSDKYKNDVEVELRKGTMSFPTASDSSQLPMAKTVLLDLQAEHLNTEGNRLNDNILGLMFEKMVLPELRRVADTMAMQKPVNIKGYNTGAKFITSFGSLNTLLVPVKISTGETIKMPLIEAFKHYGNDNGPFRENIDDFYNQYRQEIFGEIQANVNQEVDRYINQDGSAGLFVDNDIYEGSKIRYIDEQYLKSKTGSAGLPLARLISYDYVVNYMMTQRELQTLFAGDVANYFKDNMAMKLSTPTVDLTDLAKEHYPELTQDLLDNLTKNLNSPEALAFVKQNYPELLSATEIALSSLEQRYIDTNTIVKQQVADMMKDVQNNLSKRLKELISPGNKFPNSGSSQKYYQIMLNDVDSASETLKNLMDISYPGEYEGVAEKITRFKQLDDKYESNRSKEEKDEYKKLLKELQTKFPAIDGYFKNASTDAQEYTTWRDNLGQLKSQGRVTPEQYNQIYKKLEAQENDLNDTGVISDENRWSNSEKDLRKLAVMQPTKPLYSGLHYDELGGKNVSRYIYIKSSSFPLLPEMTAMFPKLEGLRKSLSKVEEYDENTGEVLVTARASYDSANKVGAAKDAANIADLYAGKLDRDTILSKYAVPLDRNNFFIQQDKPFKSDKNADAGKLDTNNRATQFEKIILGDGINKIPDHVFPNVFDQSLLDSIGVEVKDGMVNGPALTKIYNEIYRREQALKNEKLLKRFGIKDLNGLNEGNVEGMKELIKLMKERLNNKQDKEALELLYDIPGQNGRLSEKEYQDHLKNGGDKATKAMFKIPIYMMPNSKKFESVLNAVINKNNINLKLPGFSSPVASQEGFDFKGYSAEEFEKAKANGLIVTKNFDPSKGLQSSRTEDGKLKHAQVFIANKYKVYNSRTNTYDYIDLKEFVDENGIIDTDKLPEELLSMFSFRIPTSSHQSGALIEIAGFLPHTSADLMIVPKDHTTQIGEDYDIDTRYVYQYNYFQDTAGKLKKMSYDNVENVMEKAEVERITEAYNNFKKILKDTYFEGKGSPLANSALAHNRDKMLEIANLQNILENWEDSSTEKKVLQEEWELETPMNKTLIKERIANLELDILPGFRITEEYLDLKNQLTAEFRGRGENIDYFRMLDQKGNEEKILENNLISIYKSVYSTQNKEVQTLITKVLSTENAGNTAKAMDDKIKSANATGMYNIYSPHTQSGVMRAGASGKIGIGEHSNAVTANSLFQQSNYEHKLISHFKTNKEGEKIPVYFNIKLGKGLTFDGILGKTEVRGVRISELGMEDQNSATDNQKLEIMDRRNENSNTMTVLKILHANGIDKDGVSVNGEMMSYASLFVNQPIIRRYSELMNKYKSSTTDSFGSIDDLVEAELIEEFGKGVEWKVDANNVPTEGKLSDEMKAKKGGELDSKKLWDGLLVDETTDFNSQWYVYEAFKQLQSAAKKYNEVQQFINIEKSGMGVSYFDSINLADKLINMYETDKPGMSNQDKLFGKHVYEVDAEKQAFLVEKGYVRIKLGDNHFVKPETHYAHKIVNAISNGYNLYNSLFPYDHKYVKEQIDGVFASSNTNPNTKAGLELKYKIISNLKDYVYSNNKTLFDGNLDSSVKEIFFDDNDTKNKSLASYLMELQKNPEYNRIFRDPFFKDLQFDINEGTFPSLIKFNNSDISTLNNLDIHNIFLRMLGSEKKLPDYNGKPYNNDLLLRDLLKYSLLGDQGNGAIGFRHLIPLKVFDKYNVSNTVRNSTDVNNTLVQNIIYNGPYKALESLLNNEVNENGVIVNRRASVSDIKSTVTAINRVLKEKYNLDNAITVADNGDVTLNYYDGHDPNSAYVKQFYQHNPKEVAAFNYPGAKAGKNNKLSKLLTSNGFTLKMLDEGKVTNFHFEGELYAVDIDDETIKRKISKETDAKEGVEIATYIKNPFMSLKNKNGEILLFEKKTESGYYEQIPVLGVFGFNEYQVGKDIDKSKVKKNNPKTEWRNPSIIPGKVEKSLSKDTVEQIITQMREDKNGPYAAVLDLITPLIDYSNTEIKLVSDLQGNASYTPAGFDKSGNPTLPLIKVSNAFLESGITREELQAALTEEIIHHATVTTFSKYINFTGIGNDGRVTYDIVKDDSGNEVTVPSEMMTLINVYQKAFDKIAEKQGLETLLANIKNTKSDIDEKRSVSLAMGDQTDAYRVTNIHEFIVGVFLKNGDFAKEMANTQYMKSDKSIIEKFTETLIRLFNRVLPNKRTDTISAEVVRELHALLVRESNIKETAVPGNKTENEVKKAEPVTKKADQILKDFKKDVKPPTESTDKPLVETWKGFWTRKDVENNPDKVFLFGDNFEDAKTGYVPTSTQAVIRGLPNAIGISTKLDRGRRETLADKDFFEQGSYLDNGDFTMFKQHVDEQITKAIESGKTIVLPADGIGTGKAELKERAPKLLEYLNQRLKELTEYSEVVDGKVSNNLISYTPKGKQKQTYSIQGKQIFNSKGVEVFKEDSADRRKIFANYAVQQKKAVVVDFKDVKYVVNKKGEIMSVTTGDIVFKDPKHGSGKAIRGLADAKFTNPVKDMSNPDSDSGPDLSDPDMDGEAPSEFLSPSIIDTKKLTTFVDVNKQC